MRKVEATTTSAVAGPSNVHHREGRAALLNGSAVGAHGTQQQQQRRMPK